MSATTHPSAAPGAPFLVMLRGALLPSVVVSVVAVLVFAIARGGSAAVSSGAGAVGSLLFFSSGLVLMSRLLREASPMLFFAVALSVYFGQVIVLFVVLIAVRGSSWLDGTALGVTVLAVVLVWQVCSMRALRRARTPVYDGDRS